jgi:molybdopterin-guanine dinucleotide biosynthesis protein A
MITNLKKTFQKIILVCNNPSIYQNLNIQLYKNPYPQFNPISGFYTGLLKSETKKNFIITGSLPLINEEAIEYLVEYKTARLFTVAKSEEIVQESAVVADKKTLIYAGEIMQKLFKSENKNNKQDFRIMRIIDKAGAQLVDIESAPFYHSNLFLDLNTKKESELILDIPRI